MYPPRVTFYCQTLQDFTCGSDDNASRIHTFKVMSISQEHMKLSTQDSKYPYILHHNSSAHTFLLAIQLEGAANKLPQKNCKMHIQVEVSITELYCIKCTYRCYQKQSSSSFFFLPKRARHVRKLFALTIYIFSRTSLRFAQGVSKQIRVVFVASMTFSYVNDYLPQPTATCPGFPKYSKLTFH